MSKDQIQEESAEPTTFEIPKYHPVLAMREAYEAAVDIAGAKMTTLQRKHERRRAVLEAELEAELKTFKAPIQADLDALSDAIHAAVADIVPVNTATHKIKFVSEREVIIVPRKSVASSECNCPICQAQKGSGKSLLQAFFGGTASEDDDDDNDGE